MKFLTKTNNYRRKRKEIDAYEQEAFEKVWLARSYDFDSKTPIYKEGKEGCEQVLARYKDIPKEGYSDWEYGFLCGVMATLRWVSGDDEKDNLDT